MFNYNKRHRGEAPYVSKKASVDYRFTLQKIVNFPALCVGDRHIKKHGGLSQFAFCSHSGSQSGDIH